MSLFLLLRRRKKYNVKKRAEEMDLCADAAVASPCDPLESTALA